jgi:hypothetical protein
MRLGALWTRHSESGASCRMIGTGLLDKATILSLTVLARGYVCAARESVLWGGVVSGGFE